MSRYSPGLFVVVNRGSGTQIARVGRPLRAIKSDGTVVPLYFYSIYGDHWTKRPAHVGAADILGSVAAAANARQWRALEKARAAWRREHPELFADIDRRVGAPTHTFEDLTGGGRRG